MLQIHVHDKNFKLDDLIQAAKNGEEIVIVTDEQERYIVRVEKPHQQYRKFGTAKGQFSISDDFNAPLDDFDEYT